MIRIPKLTELQHKYTRDNKEFFCVHDVLDFYIENNNLIYPLTNDGKTMKIRCIKKYDDKYKIFSYKTLGVLSHSVYFLLDIDKNKLYLYEAGHFAESAPLKEWVEYLMSGGSLEKSLAENELEYDPCAGI